MMRLHGGHLNLAQSGHYNLAPTYVGADNLSYVKCIIYKDFIVIKYKEKCDGY